MYNDRTTGVVSHSHAEGSAIVYGMGRRVTMRNVTDRIQPKRQSLGDDTLGWYQHSGCRVSDGILRLSRRRWIS